MLSKPHYLLHRHVCIVLLYLLSVSAGLWFMCSKENSLNLCLFSLPIDVGTLQHMDENSVKMSFSVAHSDSVNVGF